MDFPSIIRDLGESLIAPRQVIRILIAERRGLLFGFFIVLIFSIIEGAIATLTFIGKLATWIPVGFIGWLFGGLSLLFGTTLYVILSIGYWIIGGLIVHLFCKLFNGQGLFEQTLTAFSYLWLPAFILGLGAPFILILDYITGIGLFLLLFSISFIWGLILSSQAISEVHGFGVGKALLSVISPTVILFIILIIIPLGLTL